MYHTAAAFMLFIVILNDDAFLKNPIGVKWKIPAYFFVITTYLSHNSTYLSRAIC